MKLSLLNIVEVEYRFSQSQVFSREYSHKDFCLAHLFTDLKFEGGILGLAYVGSPRRNSVGGICTPGALKNYSTFCLAHVTLILYNHDVRSVYMDIGFRNSKENRCSLAEYFKNGYTLYLNSGLSSSRNHYGQRVITREADLVTAHEFGHNWGSEHDPDISVSYDSVVVYKLFSSTNIFFLSPEFNFLTLLQECSPSASQGGSYLMYTYSVSGYDVNNKVEYMLYSIIFIVNMHRMHFNFS